MLDGQWLGPYTSTNNGLLVIDLDDGHDAHVGEFVAYGNNVVVPPVGIAPASPSTVRVPPVKGPVRLQKGQTSWQFRAQLTAIERVSGLPVAPEDLEDIYPGSIAPEYADVTVSYDNSVLHVAWTTSLRNTGVAELHRSAGGDPSQLVPLANVTSWNDFKTWALDEIAVAAPSQYLFRGQPTPKKLRTAFHRRGRASLGRFMLNDVPTLHQRLSGLTTHRFNLMDSLDYASFLALVQHHGYPTPLLDWTRSPFVAAFFAFRDLDVERAKPDDHVRIFIFDGKFWNENFERASALLPAFLYLTALEPLAISNLRAVPQQAVSLVTNIDDIETYIASREHERGVTILRAIDLPVEDRTKALRELDLMGINPGSMYPGLDGACKQVKDQFFGYK